MLVAAIKSGSSLAGKAVVFNEADDSFAVTGHGTISALELLDYEDRGLLQWADAVTREWALETAGFQARAAQAEAATAAAAEAAQAAAAEAAAAELDRVAPRSVVYEPPSSVPVPVPVQGIPAVTPGFELGPAAKRPARWVVFAEPAPGERGDTQATMPVAPGEAPASDPAPLSPAPLPAASPPPPKPAPVEDEAVPAPPSGSTAQTAASRRSDRRGALRAAERRREMAGARIRIAVYVLVATAAGIILFLVERGSF